MIARLLFRLSPLLIVCACSAGACDPGSAGFFDGLACSAGNGYQQRTVALNHASYSAQRGAASSAANAAYEERNATAARGQLATLRGEVDDMERGRASLHRQLMAAQARWGAQDMAIQAARANVNAYEAKLRTAQADPSSTNVRAAEQYKAMVDISMRFNSSPAR